MKTAERLNQYFPFDPELTDTIAEVAEQQNRYSFGELATQFGIEAGSKAVMPPGAVKKVEVLKLVPQGDHDPAQARIYHTAFGYPVNSNTAMHAMRLFAADPSQQLIVFGNPASVGMATGKLSVKEYTEVYKEKTLLPTVIPILSYLRQEGVSQTAHIGWSYGADRAAESIKYSGEYDQRVTDGVLMEPVSVIKRSMKQLVSDFIKSGEKHPAYVQQSASRPYDEVWAEDSKIKFAAWAGGLMRLSNIAIANVLKEDGFEDRADQALAAQPDVRVTIGWGLESELVPNDAIETIVGQLTASHGANRVAAIRAWNMHHAAVDDIDLQAALFLQGLRLNRWDMH